MKGSKMPEKKLQRLMTHFSRAINLNFIRRLCWRQGGAFSPCAVTASVAAIQSPSGTAAKYPRYITSVINYIIIVIDSVQFNYNIKI
jgi:hypothetical protein